MQFSFESIKKENIRNWQNSRIQAKSLEILAQYESRNSIHHKNYIRININYSGQIRIFFFIIRKLAYLFWHILVVHHCNQLLHKYWRTNLLVERSSTLVHYYVEQTQCKEDYLQLAHLKSSLYLLGYQACTIYRTKMKCWKMQERKCKYVPDTRILLTFTRYCWLRKLERQLIPYLHSSSQVK